MQRIVGDDRRWPVGSRAVADRAKNVGLVAAEQPPDESGTCDDDREWCPKHREREERCHCHEHECRVGKRALADSNHRLDNHGQYGSAETREQRSDHRRRAERNIDPGQQQQRKHARQHEQRASNQSAGSSVEQPADVDRQLLGLWAR